MSEQPDSTNGSALAGSLIAAALFDALRAKGVLSFDECREILTTALNSIDSQSTLDEERAAATLLSRMLSGPYAAPVQDK